MNSPRDDIGGYLLFGDDRPPLNDFNKDNDTYAFNLARNALRFIVNSLKINNILCPHFTCPTVKNSLIDSCSNVKFYNIGEDFKPILNFSFDESYFLLINDYFGLTQQVVNDFINKFSGRVIVDNSQSFYANYSSAIAQIYSPRKFFSFYPD